MIVLGLSRDVHDPASALVVDGEVVAAAEEERFTRVKHAPHTPPVRSARFCLESASLSASDVDLVAYPWSLDAYRENRWVFARRVGPILPRHAWRAVIRTGSRWRREEAGLEKVLSSLGVDRGRTVLRSVPHHLAHAASAGPPSGLGRYLALTADAMGEFDSAGAWLVRDGRWRKVWTLHLPDSLGTFFTAVTEFLGFEPNDGEYKTMGLAALGNPEAVDLSPFCRLEGSGAWADPRHVFPPRAHRRGGRYFGVEFERALGPPGMGERPRPPYTDIAAAAQKIVEDAVLGWLRGPLKGALESAGGNLCLAGGVALNVRLNGFLLREPSVKRLWVQPASSDAGGALGAAVWASIRAGECCRPLAHAFLGPRFESGALRRLLESRRLPFSEPPDLEKEAAQRLAGGETLGRFDGAMEWGPRALGNRSILAHPGRPGTADRVNAAVKFRERWRPFCPAVLESRAPEIFGAREPSPFMTVNHDVSPAWRSRIAEVVHADGTARIQTVDPVATPGFHRLLEAFSERTGLPVLLNTSLNRRGEPIACTPEDALDIFFGSGLDALILGPFLLSKSDLGKRRNDGGIRESSRGSR